MRDRDRKFLLNGRLVLGTEKQVLDELAFEHYPVAVDAGEGERVFDSFDEARDFVRSVFAASFGE